MGSKVISFRVSNQDWLLFEEFAKQHGFNPYKAIRGVVTTTAATKRLEALLKEDSSGLDALVELALLAQEVRAVLKVYVELTAIMKKLAESHGLKFYITV